MHRNQLKELLYRYDPIYSEEIVYKDQILRFVDGNPQCFERSLLEGHVTASCWLVNYDNSKALLTHHKKLNKWIQLGGHCDGESDVLSVALKEAREESGMYTIRPVSKEIFDIAVHVNPAYKHEPEHYHYDIRFFLQAVEDERIVVSDESNQLMWVSKDPTTFPSDNSSVIRMFDKWSKGWMPL